MSERMAVLGVLILAAAVGARPAPAQKPAAAPKAAAVAVIHPTEGNHFAGLVRFVEQGGKVTVTAELRGLKPGAQHAIHVHELGDCSVPDGTGAGGHYNPEGHAHALPPAPARHAGDLGNLQADSTGTARYEITVANLSISGKNSVLGRAVIVHEKRDDGGQPTGNAGGRIGCGVIGIAKP